MTNFSEYDLTDFGEVVDLFLSLADAEMSYEGAVVKCWNTGLYIGDVHKVDVKSMYPSIMIMLNLSPETTWLIDVKPYTGEYKFDPEHGIIEVPDEHYGQLVIGIAEQDGITRTELLDLFGERERIRASGKKDMVTDSAQKGIKLIMNACGYGYHGLEMSRYGSFLCAIVTTAVGRFIMNRIIELCKKLGVRLLECDTDGLLVYSPNIAGEKLTSMINADLHKFFKGYKYGLKVNVELESFDGVIMYASKNYVLKRGVQIMFKGSGFHGRHFPPICSLALHRFAKAIFDGEPLSVVWAEFANLKRFPLKMFTMNVSFNKLEYVGTTMYANLARKLGSNLVQGEEIFYVKCNSGYIPLGVLSDVELIRRLDYSYYRTRIKDVVGRLTKFANKRLDLFCSL